MARRNQYGQFVSDDEERTRRGRTRYDEDDDRDRSSARRSTRSGYGTWGREEHRDFGSSAGTTRRRYDEDDEGDRFGVWRGERADRGDYPRMSGGRSRYENEAELEGRFGRNRDMDRRDEFQNREGWDDERSRRDYRTGRMHPYEGHEYGRFGETSRWEDDEFTSGRGRGSMRRGHAGFERDDERDDERRPYRTGGQWSQGGRSRDDDDEDRYERGRFQRPWRDFPSADRDEPRRFSERGRGERDRWYEDDEFDDRSAYGRGTSRRGFPSIDPDEQRIVARTGGEVNRGQR